MIDKETLSNRGKQTIIRLERALERLLNGVPERTPHDGRISLSRLNQEAGLSSGASTIMMNLFRKLKEPFMKENSTTRCPLPLQVKPRWIKCARKGIKNAS